MSNQKIDNLIIELNGNIPSKKNSRVTVKKTGRSFPSAAFQKWELDAMWQVKEQTRIRIFNPIKLDVTIYFPKTGKADLDNKLSSILDMFVEVGIIQDDGYEYVPEISLHAEYRKGKGGARIVISEL